MSTETLAEREHRTMGHLPGQHFLTCSVCRAQAARAGTAVFGVAEAAEKPRAGVVVEQDVSGVDGEGLWGPADPSANAAAGAPGANRAGREAPPAPDLPPAAEPERRAPSLCSHDLDHGWSECPWCWWRSVCEEGRPVLARVGGAR